MSTPLPGWRWVPVEATEEMLRAACDCQDADPEDGLASEMYYAYRAMVAAAPHPPIAQPDALRAAAEQARAALSDLLLKRDPIVYSGALRALDEALAQAPIAQPQAAPTDEEIASWADSFILAKAFNRPIAVQIAVEAAKWVRSRLAQPQDEAAPSAPAPASPGLVDRLRSHYGHHYTTTRDGIVTGEHHDFSRHPLVGEAIAEIERLTRASAPAPAEVPMPEPVAWLHQVHFESGTIASSLSFTNEHPYAGDERHEYAHAAVISMALVPMNATPPPIGSVQRRNVTGWEARREPRASAAVPRPRGARHPRGDQDADSEAGEAAAVGLVLHRGRHGYPQAYRLLWESINGRGSWDANPWVWVLEFRKLKHQGEGA